MAVGLLILMMAPSACADETARTEADFNDSLCQTIGGERETRHYYTYGDGQQSYVSVDCETDLFVIEGGLDKRSSIDSLQQTLFFSVLTDKTPAVVIYDTDGKAGKYEHRIETACAEVGVLFMRFGMDDIQKRDALTEAFGGE